MSSRFTELIVDCHDPRALAAFWAAALDYTVIADTGELVEIAAYEPTIPGLLAAPGPSTLVFIRVPESKLVKNRLHIDLSPVGRSRDDEVARLLALGASHVDIGQGEQSWIVLADPEGNEFCVLRALADRQP